MTKRTRLLLFGLATVTSCPSCKCILKVADNLIGQPFRCPKCNHVLSPVAPAPSAASVPSQAPASQPLVADPFATCSMPSAASSTVPPTTGGGAKLPTIPGYEILAVLGRGGMGVVYKARQTKLNVNRIVALKMILAGSHATPDQLERFCVEAQAVARLQHRNIVQIHEVGEYDGLPYFSLEFCEQGNLAALLRRAPLSSTQAATLVATLARAMHAAHELKIIHRDLKPANILLNAAGDPKIADFGLAKKQDDTGGRTQSGAVMGTPSYMAPEQAAGKTKNVGPPADIYALGAILYEMLTGQPPFRAETPLDVILKVVSEEPVAPRKHRPDAPADLETICLKCLRKEPEQRYTTAQSMAEDLDRFLTDKPILARPASQGERVWRWCRRNRMIAGLTAAVAAVLCFSALVICAGVVAGVLLQNKADTVQEQLDNAVAVKKTTDDLQKQQDDAKRQQEKNAEAHLVYLEDMRNAYQAWVTNQTWDKNDQEIAWKRLDRHHPAAGQKDHRSWEWYFLRNLFKKKLGNDFFLHPDEMRVVYFGRPGFDTSIAWSLDSRRLLIAKGGEVAERNTEGVGKEPAIIDQPFGWNGWSSTLRLSPDGEHVAAIRGKRNVIFYKDKKETPNPLPPEAVEGSTIRIWNVRTRKQILSKAQLKGTFLAWSPDAKRLACGVDGAGNVEVCDISTERISRLAEGIRVSSLVWGPDGKNLALFGGDNTVEVWDVLNAKRRQSFRGHKQPIVSVAWSRDGIWLATSSSQDQTVKIWDVGTGQEKNSFRGSSKVTWSRDGLWLATLSNQDQTVKIWDVAKGREKTSFRGGGDFAWSPDGRRFAAEYKGKISIWDTTVWEEAIAFLGSGPLLWSPDGRRFVANSQAGGLVIRTADMPD